MTTPAIPPMSPERREKLIALSQAHAAFVARRLEAAAFDPGGRPEESDYNLHYADLTADDEQFHAEARAALGI